MRFAVRTFKVADGGLLTPQTREQLQAALKQYTGERRGVTDLRAARAAAQHWLDQRSPGGFEVRLPPQVLGVGGTVRLVILGKLVAVEAQGARGYPGANLTASLPSLRAQHLLATFDWRELSMAQENPLKTTRVHFTIAPDEGARALITAQAPYGDRRGYASLDNMGPASLGRLRYALGYTWANLNDRDEVLNLNAVGSQNPRESYGLSASYRMPLYAEHQSLSLSLFDTRSNLGNLQSNDASFSSNGTGQAGTLQWSYYFPRLGLGLADQLKLDLAYSFRHYTSAVNLTGFQQSIVQYGLKTAPLILGLSQRVTVQPGLDLLASISITRSFAGALGASRGTALAAAREGAGSYTLVSYQLGLASSLNGWGTTLQWTGQHTTRPLLPNEQMSISGAYAINGLRDAVVSGDQVDLIRGELAGPQQRWGKVGLNAYAYADWGHLSNLQSSGAQATASAASLGLGLRVICSATLSAEILGAHLVEGARYEQGNRNSVLASLLVNF